MRLVITGEPEEDMEGMRFRRGRVGKCVPKDAPKTRARKPSLPIIKTEEICCKQGSGVLVPSRAPKGDSESEGQEASHAAHHHQNNEKNEQGARMEVRKGQIPSTVSRRLGKREARRALAPFVMTQTSVSAVDRRGSGERTSSFAKSIGK